MHGSVREAEQKWTSFDKDADLSTCRIHIKVTQTLITTLNT